MSATPVSKQLLSPALSHLPRLQWSRRVSFRFVGALLGLLLLAAAYQKFRDLTWEPFGKALFIPPGLRIIFIEVEAILGAWLLTGVARRTLWSVSVLYFTILAGVSVYLASHGEPTCGCFGRVAFNPWLAFAIDLAAIGALAVTAPRFGALAESTHTAGASGGRTVALWAAIAFGMVAVVQVVRAGGMAPAWEALIAQSVIAEPTVTEIGSGTNEESALFQVTLHNYSDHVVQIIGGTNNCVGNATLSASREIFGAAPAASYANTFFLPIRTWAAS